MCQHWQRSDKKTAIRTTEGLVPLGLDADGWQRINIWQIYQTIIIIVSLESLVAYRLITLNKNPGLRTIGVGEVLRKTSGKVAMMIIKQDVMEAAGSL